MLQGSGRRPTGRTQPGANARDELLGVEGLDDVVVGTGLEPLDDIRRVAPGGEHDDRHAGLIADARAHLDAVHAGQHEVEQHQIGLGRVDGVDGRGTVRAEGGLETLRAQHDADHLGERDVIVDDQDSRVHIPSHPTRDTAWCAMPRVRTRVTECGSMKASAERGWRA